MHAYYINKSYFWGGGKALAAPCVKCVAYNNNNALPLIKCLISMVGTSDNHFPQSVRVCEPLESAL